MSTAGTDTHDEYTMQALLLVEEHSQLITFFSHVKGYEARAQDQDLTILYHLFWDHYDDSYRDAGYALVAYLRQRAEGREDIRLYVRLYEDEENDVMAHEDCLLAYGNYPS